MLVVVQHQLIDPPTAFVRGERLKRAEGAPEAARVLQFLPSRDGTLVTCLWESESVDDLRSYVDETLGDASRNVCYAVEETAAFAELPTGIATPPAPVVA
jgi:hypothetical protein